MHGFKYRYKYNFILDKPTIATTPLLTDLHYQEPLNTYFEFAPRNAFRFTLKNPSTKTSLRQLLSVINPKKLQILKRRNLNTLRSNHVFHHGKNTTIYKKSFKQVTLLNHHLIKQMYHIRMNTSTRTISKKKTVVTALSKFYTLHPYFNHFEQKLTQSNWTFIGTPLFESYYWQDINYGFKLYDTQGADRESIDTSGFNLNQTSFTRNKLTNLNTLFDLLLNTDLSEYHINSKPLQNDQADEWLAPEHAATSMWGTPYLFFTKSFVKTNTNVYPAFLFLQMVTDFVTSALDTPSLKLQSNAVTADTSKDKMYEKSESTRSRYFKRRQLSQILNVVASETCDDLYLARIAWHSLHSFKKMKLDTTLNQRFDCLIRQQTQITQQIPLILLNATYRKLEYLSLQPLFLLTQISKQTWNTKINALTTFRNIFIQNTLAQIAQPRSCETTRIKSLIRYWFNYRKLLRFVKPSKRTVKFFRKCLWRRRFKKVLKNTFQKVKIRIRRYIVPKIFWKVVSNKMFLGAVHFRKNDKQYLQLSDTLVSLHNMLRQKKPSSRVRRAELYDSNILYTLLNRIQVKKLVKFNIKENTGRHSKVQQLATTRVLQPYHTGDNFKHTKIASWKTTRFYWRETRSNDVIKHKAVMMMTRLSSLFKSIQQMNKKIKIGSMLSLKPTKTVTLSSQLTPIFTKIFYTSVNVSTELTLNTPVLSNNYYLQWFFMNFNSYPVTSNAISAQKFATIAIDEVVEIKKMKLWGFFKQQVFEFMKLSTADDLDPISTVDIFTSRPCFKTLYDTRFLLGAYGFYFTFILNPDVMLDHMTLRSYWQTKYSFYDSTTLKKNILKKFITNQDSAIDAPFAESLYSTPGFNFYNIKTMFKLSRLVPITDTQETSFYGDSFIEDDDVDKSLRIKFKPGYSTIWRRVRTSFKNVFFLRFKYQHRLTDFIMKHEWNTYGEMSMRPFSETAITSLLIRNKFATDPFWSEEMLASQFVFLNGFVVNNPQTSVIKGDFVQLLIHIKYYMIMKWQNNLTIIRKSRVLKLAQKKFKPKTTRLGVDRSYRYPDWLLNLRFFETDVPSYVELDLFTLSFLVITNPYMPSHYHIYQSYITYPLVMRLYNWKYIN